ncbi:hypothetical protein KIN20_032451 [Parelaphostrongylus tenuis]|uniref:Uncharacterized protein n=1 Tax=Parelaphostrongylus tenuis TaxID=148309 RepID=A0AAD5R6X3_PARTN|nr:hypothetical protein KIN20_032451 [Parelaphostrongylus tenuis]
MAGVTSAIAPACRRALDGRVTLHSRRRPNTDRVAAPETGRVSAAGGSRPHVSPQATLPRAAGRRAVEVGRASRRQRAARELSVVELPLVATRAYPIPAAAYPPRIVQTVLVALITHGICAMCLFGSMIANNVTKCSKVLPPVVIITTLIFNLIFNLTGCICLWIHQDPNRPNGYSHAIRGAAERLPTAALSRPSQFYLIWRSEGLKSSAAMRHWVWLVRHIDIRPNQPECSRQECNAFESLLKLVLHIT